MKGNKIYKAGTYRRLSREDGDNLESESIINQSILINDFLSSTKENIIFKKEYTDDGYSGGNFDRPGWNKLMEDIDNGLINTIITKDLSRMGRDYISMGEYIEKIFPEKNIRYIAINDDIDTLYETPGLEMLQFKLVFNDFYIKETSKKIRKIMKEKKEKGQYTGWKGVYGYKRDPNDKHKLIVDEKVKPIVERMFNLALEGKTPYQIANIFTQEGIPTPSVYANINRNEKLTTYKFWCARTIEEMLKNPTYIGNLTQGKRKKINYKSKKEIRVPKEEWIIVENTHKPIIDKDIFDIVQTLLGKNRKRKVKDNTQLFTGFIFCKECGHTIGFTRSMDGKRLYCHCNYYTKNSKYGLCTPHTCNYKKLEDLIINKIKEIFNSYLNKNKLILKLEDIKKQYDVKLNTKKNINILNKKIDTFLNYKDEIYNDKLCGNIDLDMYNRMILKYNNIINGLNKDKDRLVKKFNSLNNDNLENNGEFFLNKVEEFLSLKNPNRKLIASLIDKITFSEDKKVEIFYKFKL